MAQCEVTSCRVRRSDIPLNRVDSELSTWETLHEDSDWQGILIGNGASRAVWENFRYSSLYETAVSTNVDYPLLDADQHLFREMDTTNFERVLDALATSRTVCDALGIDVTPVRERYGSIQGALFEAVAKVHPKWQDEDAGAYNAVASELSQYDFVFSTNYDLVAYWSMMIGGGGGFKDYFFTEEFDLTDTEIWGGPVTKVLYLHGGVHLAKRALSGATVKRRAPMGMNLLSSLDVMSDEDLVPLVVTEGTARDKLTSIHRSDYLSFAYQQLAQHTGPFVVFGSALQDNDQHLVNAMRSWRGERIAISVYPTGPHEIVALKANLHKKLPNAELLFFDSTTHPLGSAEVRIADQD